ncbi:MAG: preprotein translocase subunit SecG [Candidatus Saganbacteria bacterium]|nr:preprotein translocase subunit SecG [Candidatus Saganbacteria bacterium]
MRLVLLVFQLTIAVALIVSVLLHTAKGEGLGGIGGSAKLFGSPKGMEKGLDRITWACAIGFLAISVVLVLLK